MDSKTRHELEKNELLKWITHQYEDWILPNKNWLGYAVLGVLVVIVVIFATARVTTWNQQAAWKQFYSALNSPNAEIELELVANSTSGIVSASARLALAQWQLAEGKAEAAVPFPDRSKVIALLDGAITTFQQVQKATSDPMILQQAGFGLGECWETLAVVRIGDDLSKAEKAYQEVVERWGDGFKGKRAQQQLALLQQPTTRLFLERQVMKMPEVPAGMEGFRVEFDRDDPFNPGGFDLDSRFNLNPGALIPETLFPEPQRPDTEPAEPVLVEPVPAEPIPVPVPSEPAE